jgi:cell division protein FtsI/penicillin-binding protein 2
MNRRDLCLLGLATFAARLRSSPEPSLFAQSLQAELSSINAELLVLDARAQQILANTFADPLRPMPVGSLLKPFLAFAYLTRPHATLRVVCRGHVDRCWSLQGHGALTLQQALAQSCNAYFLALAQTLRMDEIGVPTPPPRTATAEDLIGLTAAWPVAPYTLARTYALLLCSPATPPEILEGMRLAATEGTALRIGVHPGGVLAKTGTAPCVADSAPCKATGDGLVLAAVPADSPKLVLLVRRRATTGAVTAATAGRVLTELKEAHAY